MSIIEIEQTGRIATAGSRKAGRATKRSGEAQPQCYGRVRTLRLNRPAKMNALSEESASIARHDQCSWRSAIRTSKVGER